MNQTVEQKTKFFHFSQNNSGGYFDFELNKITHHVIIEAKNADHANFLAEEIGLYFNGCNSGIDCSCCGDRWYHACGEGDDTALIYGIPLEKYTDMWFGDKQPHTYVHYLDGVVKGYYNPLKAQIYLPVA